MSTTTAAEASAPKKLNVLGKVLYTTGFFYGTGKKCAKASAAIIREDYKEYKSIIKTL